MRRPLALTAAVLLTAVLVVPVVAQDESVELTRVITLDIDPADFGTWSEGVMGIVEAARQAGLPYERGWSMWQDNIFRVTIVIPLASMATLDDPDYFVKQFLGTEGESTLMESFETLNSTFATQVSDGVYQGVTDWSRETDTDMSAMMAVHVDNLSLKRGADEATFAELIGEFLAIQEEVGYRYPTFGYRARIGGASQFTFVTPFDNRANFYGAHGLDRLIEERGMTERWQGLLQQFSAILAHAEHTDSDLMPALSYFGSGPEESGEGSP